MKKLKNYQLDAIKQLVGITDVYMTTPKNETIVFQSPTGSGKTITMSRFILEMSEKSTQDVCFIWISIGKGDLHVQSYKSVKKEIGDLISCSLLENEFFGSRDEIEESEIVFVNWEKIRNKDKKTDEFKNILMKDNEQNNFPTILKNTRKKRKIILVIDESHSGATTERAMEIRDEIIQPELTFEMSATPAFKDENVNTRVVVDPKDVIEEGMIKKEVIINDKIAEIIEKEENETTSENLVLESAYYKEEELKRRYEKAYERGETEQKIVPLTLIQIPNSAYGDAKREKIEEFLKTKGITTENGKLAILLSDEKINEEHENLKALDSKVEYLIFKMAIDTGWDCPRAQILLKFREVSSITFEIQTLGRILRMPEAKHYSDEMLNRAYVYSNIQSIKIKKEIYNPNVIKTFSSAVKEEYKPEIAPAEDEFITQQEFAKEYEEIISEYKELQKNKQIDEKENIENIEEKKEILKENKDKSAEPEKRRVMTLKSYYKKRTDYGDVTSSFYKVYEREFCNYFKIKEINDSEMTEYALNKEKLKAAGIKFGYRKKDSILSDVHVDSKEIDNEVLIDEQDLLVDIVMSDVDLQYDFDKVVQNNLNGFAPVRSIPTVKKAIMIVFEKYLGIKSKNKGILQMQNLVVNNTDLFGAIISNAIESYKPIHKYEVEQKDVYEINEEWHIPYDKSYNPNTCKIIESKLSIHQPLYMETRNGKVDALEVEFIKFLDTHENEIEYFWKNGSEHMNTNFGIEKEDGSAFQPDFLIQFRDGRIGIFDTKAGKGFNENDNRAKSDSLQQYIVDENRKGKNLIGGLVIKDKGKFYFYDRGVYNSYKDRPDLWKNFEEVFK